MPHGHTLRTGTMEIGTGMEKETGGHSKTHTPGIWNFKIDTDITN